MAALALPSAHSLAPRPRYAAVAPEPVGVLEARQRTHVEGLDAAYVEGYTVMREAAGQDLAAPNLLAGAYAAYGNTRRALLGAAAAEQAERWHETGKFVPRNRFLLGAAAATDIMAPTGACAPLGGAAGGALAGSYLSWRRQLLAYRFEKRRAGLTDELVRRLAAEAMQRALDAESAEREHHDYATRAAGDARHAALRGEPLVWRCAQHFASALGREDEVLLSLHMGGRSPARRRGGGGGSGGGGPPHHAPAASLSATQVWAQHGGGAAAAGALQASEVDGSAVGLPLPGARTITSVAFAPKGNDCFAVATGAGVVFLCSAATGEKWATLTGHSGPIIALDWSPPENRDLFLLTVSQDATARIWHVTLPKVVAAAAAAPAGARPVVQVAAALAATPAAPAAGHPLPAATASSSSSSSSSSAAEQEELPSSVGASSSQYAALHSPPRPSTARGGGGADGSSGSLTPPPHATEASSRGRATLTQQQQQSFLSTPPPTAGGGRGATTMSLPPSGSRARTPAERAGELERARARMLADSAAERERSAAARGPVLVGGGAYCAKVVPLEGALAVGASYYSTGGGGGGAAAAASGSGSSGGGAAGGGVITHAAWCPSLPSLFILAVAEEADLRLEAAAAEAEAAVAASRRGSLADASSGLDSAADRDDDAGGSDDVTGGGGGGGGGANNPFAQQLRRGLLDAGAAMRQAGKATMTAIEGGVGGAAKLTAALAKAAGGGDFVTAPSVGGGGGGGGGSAGGAGARAVERRGAILVVDARTGRVVQTRQIKGSKVALSLPGVAGIARGAGAPMMLSQSLSYATALAFSASGRQLYVADGKGCLHEYAIEGDAAEAQSKPLKSHAVVFGEGAHAFAPIAAPRAPGSEHAGGGAGGAAGGGSGLFGGFGGMMLGMGATAGGGGSPLPPASAAGSHSSSAQQQQQQQQQQAPPFLTSLFFRPYDASLRCPVLIGLDSHHHARALLLPVQTSSGDYRPPPSASEAGRIAAGAAALKVAQAAKAGARMAVGAMEVVAKGAAAAAVVSAAAATGMNLNINMGGMGLGAPVPQATEVDFLQYVAAAAAAAPAAAVGGDSGRLLGGTAASSLRPVSLFHTLAPGSHASLSAQQQRGAAPPSSHTCLLPCRLNDGLVVGTAGGDVLVCDPHTESAHHAAANNRTLGRSVGLGGLAVGGATRENVPAALSGIVPSQVVARLPGGHAPGRTVTGVVMNRDETVLLSADDGGGLTAWRKVPLSVAEAAAAAAATARGGLTSPVGAVSSARLAALFEAQGGVRSIGRFAADEARQLALGHLGGGGGGGAGQAPSIGSRSGFAFAAGGGGGGGGSVGGGGAGASRRALPSSWTTGAGGAGAGAAAGGPANVPRPAHRPVVSSS